MDIDTNLLKDLEGYVIYSLDYKETSRIIKIFTKRLGVISVMARGAKNPKSKKMNLTSPYCKSKFNLKKSRGFYYLIDGEIIDANLGLRTSIDNLYYSQLFSEIILKTVYENMENNEIYDFYDKILKHIDKIERKDILLAMFLLKYSSMLGYKPNLLSCINCGKDRFNRVYFNIDYGGIVCQDCYGPVGGIALSRQDYTYLTQLLYEKIDRADEIDFPKARADEINRILMRFLFDKTEIKKLNSWDFIEKLKLL